ncbi:MAG: GIY-YIG nuclease family protein [Ignavibacteria bacterium]|nr:GIY-YIG nuclease family protein [Ignavibacteria bacterium]
MACVYVLWSSSLQKRYVGRSSGAAEARLRQHNQGHNRFTRGGIPWILVYSEEDLDHKSANTRERFLKSGQGRKWLDQQLPRFSRKAHITNSERCRSG